jgi:exonuclease III
VHNRYNEKFNIDYVGIQETKKSEFNDKYLEEIVGRKQLCWNWLPSTGSAGGILMGVNSDIFSVERWIIRTFLVSCEVVMRKDNFKCRITNVYGTPYEEKKQDFMDELEEIMSEYRGPSIIGGDFNLVRSIKHKSNGIVDFK